MVFELKERKKKTRVVCTIGPASENEKMLRKLILAGMNVMRLNFSHGDFEPDVEKVEVTSLGERVCSYMTMIKCKYAYK